jgi:hypothetical protein
MSIKYVPAFHLLYHLHRPFPPLPPAPCVLSPPLRLGVHRTALLETVVTGFLPPSLQASTWRSSEGWICERTSGLGRDAVIDTWSSYISLPCINSIKNCIPLLCTLRRPG